MKFGGFEIIEVYKIYVGYYLNADVGRSRHDRARAHLGFSQLGRGPPQLREVRGGYSVSYLVFYCTLRRNLLLREGVKTSFTMSAKGSCVDEYCLFH